MKEFQSLITVPVIRQEMLIITQLDTHRFLLNIECRVPLGMTEVELLEKAGGRTGKILSALLQGTPIPVLLQFGTCQALLCWAHGQISPY